MPQKHPSQMDQIIFQVLRGMIIKIAEDLDPSEVDELFSHELEDPRLLQKLTSHFDKRHAALKNRKPAPAPAPPVARDSIQAGRQANELIRSLQQQAKSKGK